MKDELFVLGEDLFEIGAVGVDPEFSHAAWAVKTSRDETVALTLAHVANVDNDNTIVAVKRDGIIGRNFFDMFLRCRDEILHACRNRLCHCSSPFLNAGCIHLAQTGGG